MHRESGVRHLREAMVINFGRGWGYALKSRGISLFVSIPLILSELSFLLILGFFDVWGKRFNREGIDIISGDYVSMSKANPSGTALRLTGIADASEHRALSQRLGAFQKEAFSACRAGDFQKVADFTYVMVKEVIAVEERSQALFPMYRHILESLGIAAVHALDYLKESNGRTMMLSKWFVVTQINALMACPYFDRFAQRCHHRGVGIIENDVPYIPFVEAYEAAHGPSASD